MQIQIYSNKQLSLQIPNTLNIDKGLSRDKFLNKYFQGLISKQKQPQTDPK